MAKTKSKPKPGQKGSGTMGSRQLETEDMSDRIVKRGKGGNVSRRPAAGRKG